MKRIKISDSEFKMLNDGKHVCINGVSRFIRLIVENIETSEEIICDVSQVGGIFNYSCAIRKE